MKIILKKLTAVLLAATLVLGTVIIGAATGDYDADYDSDLGVDLDDYLGFDFDDEWDDFDFGYGGFAGITPSSAVVEVPTGTAALATYVSAGGRHAVVLKADGSLWAWGVNNHGQLGDGTRTLRPQANPARVGGSAAVWASVSAGDLHTMGIMADGSLWGWGSNGSSRLGDGTTTMRTEPTRIGTATWTSISAGRTHTMGIRSDGSLWGWGSSDLGDGTTTRSAVPMRIGDSYDWVSVSAGGAHTMGIKADGSLWAWGNNDNGRLGDGTVTRRREPTRIGGAYDWVSVSAGRTHTMGIRLDGSLWAWGSNAHGRLGDGTTLARRVPTRIGTDNWASVSAGENHTMGIRADGSLWAWGNNAQGQFGTGQRSANVTAPMRIGTAYWLAVSAGNTHTVAITNDGRPFSWGRIAVEVEGDVFTHGMDADDFTGDAKLNLVTERVELRTPDGEFEDFPVLSFSVDGRRWRDVPNNRNFHEHILPQLLNNRHGMPNLHVSDRGRNVRDSTRLLFPAVEGRPRPRIVVNYDFRDAQGNLVPVATPTGFSTATYTSISSSAPHGTWALTTRGTRRVPAELLDYNVYLIATATHIVGGRVRNINVRNVATWTSIPMTTLANGQPVTYVQPIDAVTNRVTRTRYFVRAMSTAVEAAGGESSTFTPMSRPVRINISSALRAPNIRPRRNTLNLRANTMLVSGDMPGAATITGWSETRNPLVPGSVAGTFTARTQVTNASGAPVADLIFRTASTPRRPASMPTAPITLPAH